MADSDKRTRFTHGDDVYIVEKKKGQVFVKVERTAPGQKLICGVFDPKNNTWYNENRKAPVPNEVKLGVARAFTWLT